MGADLVPNGWWQRQVQKARERRSFYWPRFGWFMHYLGAPFFLIGNPLLAWGEYASAVSASSPDAAVTMDIYIKTQLLLFIAKIGIAIGLAGVAYFLGQQLMQKDFKQSPMFEKNLRGLYISGGIFLVVFVGQFLVAFLL